MPAISLAYKILSTPLYVTYKIFEWNKHHIYVLTTKNRFILIFFVIVLILLYFFVLRPLYNLQKTVKKLSKKQSEIEIFAPCTHPILETEDPLRGISDLELLALSQSVSSLHVQVVQIRNDLANLNETTEDMVSDLNATVETVRTCLECVNTMMSHLQNKVGQIDKKQ